MLSWLGLHLLPLLPLIVVRRIVRRLPSLGLRMRAKARARQRGMRLHPAKRTRLLGQQRTRRKLENKPWKEQSYIHTIMRTVPMP